MNFKMYPPRSGKTQKTFDEFKVKCEFYTPNCPQCNNPNSFNLTCEADRCSLVIGRGNV